MKARNSLASRVGVDPAIDLQLEGEIFLGDTVGDPFKDTSSVALNPVIKFTTLFGLLAVELAVSAAVGCPP